MIAPNAVDLLVAARSTVLEALLPSLPSELHYQCRMVANALAIAVRELELGEQVADLESHALDHVLEPQGTPHLPHERALGALVKLIRQGDFDRPGAGQASLQQALTAITEARLSVSNPKVLNHGR
ncbi:DUF6285 domain-containing protein [Pseudomonas citronellolis]|uniref:DUF6285 domain-containing protein n=1 Tax=Pseudomonas citronellolis TaxID=53408 RepID=UPI002648DC62|nr:DUF6285 domain-containing protein [Pseudomonas citronellolis]MDN6875668.1 DUF6285 domain-containing protein [Pseudomonas citronellolis]